MSSSSPIHDVLVRRSPGPSARPARHGGPGRSRHGLALWIVPTILLLPWGCGTDPAPAGLDATGDSPDATDVPDADAMSCGPCAIPLADGGCHPVGVADCTLGWTRTAECGCEPGLSTCGDGEFPSTEGGCKKVGPTCGEGWEAALGGGCQPLLDPCSDGMIPLLGGGCQEVGPRDECGEGTWGNTPGQVTSGKAWYVWGGFAGDESDGSAEKPFARVQDAIDRAQPGDSVLVGADPEAQVYAEGISIARSVTLRGRCSGLVRLTGQIPTGIAGMTAAISIRDASDVVVAGISVGGNGSGLVIENGTGVALGDLDVSGGSGNGIVVRFSTGVGIERVRVADSRPGSGLDWGDGIYLEGSKDVRVTGCVIEGNDSFGIDSYGSELALDRSVVRDTALNSDGELGFGLHLAEDSDGALDHDLFAGNAEFGIQVSGSRARVDGCIVRDTLPDRAGQFGVGLAIQDGRVADHATARSTATIRSCLIDSNTSIGIGVARSTATVEQTLVRDTKPDPVNQAGSGIQAEDDGNLTLTSCTIRGNHVTGIQTSRSRLTMKDCAVLDTVPDSGGNLGRGLAIQDGSTALLDTSDFAGNTETGIQVLASSLTLGSCRVKGTLPNAIHSVGIGVAISDSTASLVSSAILENGSAGITVFDQSTLDAHGVLVQDSDPLARNEGFGMIVGEASSATLTSCALLGNSDVGVMASQASILVLDHSRVANSRPGKDGTFGYGLDLYDGVDATVRSSTVTGNSASGIIVSNHSNLALESSVVGDTRTGVDGISGRAGYFGSGIWVQMHSGLTMTDSRVFRNSECGVSLTESHGALLRSRISGVTPSLGKWIVDGVAKDVPESIADGLIVQRSDGDVDVDSCAIGDVQRYSVVFDHSSGRIADTWIDSRKDNLILHESSVEQSGNHCGWGACSVVLDPEQPLVLPQESMETPGAQASGGDAS